MKLNYIYQAIEKDLEERTVKHPVTERARNIGKTGKWDKYIDPLSEEEMDEITYWDGTKIRFLGGVAEVVSPDGETIRYEGNDRIGYYTEGYEIFENDQGSEIQKQKNEQTNQIDSIVNRDAHINICTNFLDNANGDGEYGISDMIKEISDVRAKKGPNSPQEQEIIKKYKELLNGDGYLYNSGTVDDGIIVDKMIENSLNFDETCKNNHFDSSFLTVNIEKETPDLTKRIITNEDWKTEMNLANDDALIGTVRGIDDYGNELGKNSGWTIINMREGSNPANCGIDLSVPCDETRAFPGNPNGYFLTAPGQKTERYIIDEKNKIIVQRPYKAGMEGHY